jgi:uncharacterized membrane protein YfcA
MVSVLEVVGFGVLGLLAGTLSGLFGIGGGMVVVPGLLYLFQIMDLPAAAVMHLAAGSAMAIMIFTSLASAWCHHRRGDVQWSYLWRMLPAIALGVFLGKGVAHQLNTAALEACFGLFLVAIALKMLLNWFPTPESPAPPHRGLTYGVGTVLGLKSGILGIGGGAISVPFLLYSGLSMGQASGTSAAFTFPIAVLGTVMGLALTPPGGPVSGSIGTLYWPAVALVAPFTMLGAPIGTQLCHILPAQRLKRWFALFLCLLGLRLLGSWLGGLGAWA